MRHTVAIGGFAMMLSSLRQQRRNISLQVVESQAHRAVSQAAEKLVSRYEQNPFADILGVHLYSLGILAVAATLLVRALTNIV